MSEFASMLASFKKNAASTSSSSSNQQPSARGSSSATTQPNQRKRPHPSNNDQKRTIAPSFPSMHSNMRKEDDFELSFLVIGSQKAGTSWIHTMLQKCNKLALPREQKEVHFWDWHYKKGFDWYIRQFGLPQRLDNRSDTLLHYGEVTPDYIVLPPSTIAEIYKCFPDMKVIFVARDMVDRVWSAMIMELRDQNMGLNPGEFAAGIISGNKRAKKSSEAAALSVAQQRRLQQQSSPSAQPDSYYLDRLRSETHTSRSDYATHLRNWYQHFPSENILLLDFREINSNPRDLLLKIVQHIGLDEADANAYVEGLSDEDVRQRVNAATNTKTSANLKSNSVEERESTSSQEILSQRPQLRKQIQSYLRPYATKFNSLLKEEGYQWALNEFTR